MKQPPSRFEQDRFAVGLWVAPPFDGQGPRRYKELADAGFNTIIGDFSGAPPKAYLPVLRRHDFRAILWTKGDDPGAFPDDKTIWGYALQDEPPVGEFPKLAARQTAIRQKRPGKLAYVNLFPDYASVAQLGGVDYEEYLARFVREVGVDVLSMDHYPIFKPDADGRDGYCRNLDAMRRHAQAARIPFWNFFNAMPYGPHTDPTESQLRWQIAASIAYGAKGVFYFCYFTPRGDEFPKGGAVVAVDGTRTRHWEQAQRLNATLKALGPTLMQLSDTRVFRVRPGDDPSKVLAGTGVIDLMRAPVDPPGDYLVGVSRHADGRRAIWLMNYRFAYSAWPTVEFAAPPDRVREVDPRTGREVPLRDESPDMPGLQLPLADGEGRLFLLPPG